jgi:hypothetical protein
MLPRNYTHEIGDYEDWTFYGVGQLEDEPQTELDIRVSYEPGQSVAFLTMTITDNDGDPIEVAAGEFPRETGDKVIALLKNGAVKC